MTINDNKMCPFTTIQPLNLIPVAGNQLVITFSASQWTNSFRTHAKSPPLTQVKSFRLDARTLNHMLMKLVRLQSISLAGCGQRRRSSVRTFLPPTDWIRPRKKNGFQITYKITLITFTIRPVIRTIQVSRLVKEKPPRNHALILLVPLLLTSQSELINHTQICISHSC